MTDFPATHVVHWPSGPVVACDKHAKLMKALGEHLGGHIALTLITEPAECINCVNEAKE